MTLSKKKTSNAQLAHFYNKGKWSLVDVSTKDGKWEIKKSNHNNQSTLYLIPALVDLKGYLGEPGNDLAESLESIMKCADAGGFERILVHSNENRLLKNKEDIAFVTKSGKTILQPVGSAVKGIATEEMSDMYEMHKAGATVFAFPGIGAKSGGVTQRTHQYIHNFGGLLMTNVYDAAYNKQAMVAETAKITELGFSGAPDFSELTIVQRDIAIANYNCAPIHFSGITTKESVAAIARAKKEGIRVTCDVSIFSLCYTDEDLETYDANLKVFPFLRTQEHQKALLKGLKDGTIDAIASYHQPQQIEDKLCEFSFAKFGAISLQTFISMALKHVIPHIGWDTFVKVTSINPMEISQSSSSDHYILVDTELEWSLNEKTNLSLAKNTSLFGTVLKGKVIGKNKI